MGLIMLILVISGFGSAALVRGLNPLTLPPLFHVHAVSYIAWFGLFLVQASLIGANKRALHIKLGQVSLLLVIAMLTSGWLMAQGSYGRVTPGSWACPWSRHL